MTHHWQRPDQSAVPTAERPTSANLVDPEDDLPSDRYAGDFETTLIPHYDSNHSGSVRSSSSGYGVMNGQEPLPYQPQSTGTHSVFASEDVAEHLDHFGDERVRAASRRGTQHLGLLILRVGLGAVLVAHGLQKIFGWWGGQGLTGFKNSLSDIGYQHADILAYCAAGGEIAAGVLLVLGLFTPIAAAGALAYLINGVLAGMSAQHNGRSFPFFLPDGHEYEITPDRDGGRRDPGRPRPLRLRRRSGLGAAPVHRVVRRTGGRDRRRRRAVDVAQRQQPGALSPYGLGTRPSLAWVS